MGLKRPKQILTALPTIFVNFVHWLQDKALRETISPTQTTELPELSAAESVPTGPIPQLDHTALQPTADLIVNTPGKVSDLMAFRLLSDMMRAAERSIRIRSMSVPRRRYHAAFRRMTLAHKAGPVDGLRRYLKDVAITDDSDRRKLQ